MGTVSLVWKKIVLTKIDLLNEIIIILAMGGSKYSLVTWIMVRTCNSKAYEIIDIDIEKDKGSIIKCAVPSFLLPRKNIISLTTLDIDSIYPRYFENNMGRH